MIKTVNWPFYGRDKERTRYLDAPHVKPPFATRWTFKGRRLLEYSPIAVGGAIYGMNNNGLAFSIKKRTRKGALDARDRHAERLRPGLRQPHALHLQPRPRTGHRDRHQEREDGLAAFATGAHRVLAGGRREHGDRRLRMRERSTPSTGDGQDDLADAARRSRSRRRRRSPTESPTSATTAGTMSAVRISDGTIKWQSDSQGTGVGRPAPSTARRRSPSAASTRARRTAASTASTGTPATSSGATRSAARSTRRRRPARLRPAPRASTSAPMDGSRFYALDARNGNERWSADVGGSVIGAASVIGNIVYVANLQDHGDRRLQRRERKQGLRASRTAPTTR